MNETEIESDENIPPQNATEDQTNAEKKDLEQVPAEILNSLPPEAKKVLEFGMSMQRIGPMPNPIAEKITETHISKILDIAENDDKMSFEDSKESRKYTLIYVVIFSLLFVFATVYLVAADKELYKEFIRLFAAFLGGLGSGFGLKSYIDRKK